MSLVVRQPTATQTPDATLAGLAVTGITNTGHGSTVTSSSANNGATDLDEKSARWFGLQNVSGQRSGVRLKLSWTASGTAGATDDGVGGAGQGAAAFIIEYSLNGGSSWTTVVTEDALADSPGSGSDSFTNNNSADIALPNNQDISLVEVRADYNTSAFSSGLGNTGSGSVTVTVSGIQVEVTVVDAQPIVFW